MTNNRHVRGSVAAMMSLAVALALIAFVSPISAVPVGEHDISFVSHTYDATSDTYTWTYTVTSGSSPSLSHWSIAWCNPGAISEITEIDEYGNTYVLVEGTDWVYDKKGNDYNGTLIIGIKLDKGYVNDETRTVQINLLGNWPGGNVLVGTKAGQIEATGSIWGPVCTGGEIPEFTTIAIPAIAILGLFALYHRKQKK